MEPTFSLISQSSVLIKKSTLKHNGLKLYTFAEECIKLLGKGEAVTRKFDPGAIVDRMP